MEGDEQSVVALTSFVDPKLFDGISAGLARCLFAGWIELGTGLGFSLDGLEPRDAGTKAKVRSVYRPRLATGGRPCVDGGKKSASPARL